jgi:hypothetical protein
MFGLVTRRRHNAELAAIRSYCDALRERCETAEKNEATERVARRTITRQHAELDAANRRLEGRLLELGRRLSAMAEADPEYAAKLEQRVARLRHVGARILDAYTAEKSRADRLASHLDSGDLKAIKAWDARVQAHDEWVRPANPDDRPYEGGTGRPTHPAVELRQAQERCRKLQARLDGRGKQVAS